jgi:2,4-dienoyl-CoA reductase-like NADH-dependent reductase (Old Yellow Enzyme family)
MEHKRFLYKHIDELCEDIARAGVELPVADSLDALRQSLTLYKKTLSNRLIVHPMEGCDGNFDGSPGPMTLRRYDRFARGGAGLLWGEACAVNSEARANPLQIWINRTTLPAFRSMADNACAAAQESMDPGFKPYTVLQLTHSGRYSKSFMGAEAIVAVAENPVLDPFTNPQRRLITDDELETLEDQYVEAARLAREAGFDAVDIKGCHRYLINELLSAQTRPGKYGGSFENRTRFLLNIIDKTKAAIDIDIALRINAHDAIPAPYGWGCDAEGRPDLTEPKQLMKILESRGIRLVNISTGNPYYNPHIGRPADTGPYVPPEHPIESAARMLGIIREMKAAAPAVHVVGTGFSWFREYGAHIAAGCIEKGWFDLAGFGRQSFAYPDFAKDIILHGAMDRKKCCIACTKCTELMRFGREAGCVIRDAVPYLGIWREATAGRTMMSKRIAIHL